MSAMFFLHLFKSIFLSYETSIGLKRTFYSKLPSPYSSCVEDVHSADGYDSKFFKAMFNNLNLKAYRQKYW